MSIRVNLDNSLREEIYDKFRIESIRKITFLIKTETGKLVGCHIFFFPVGI